MPSLGGWEWVILAVVALILFGGTKLAGAGRNAGRAIREFKEETRAIKDDEARHAEAEGEVVDAELIEPKPNTEQKPDQQG